MLLLLVSGSVKGHICSSEAFPSASTVTPRYSVPVDDRVPIAAVEGEDPAGLSFVCQRVV